MSEFNEPWTVNKTGKMFHEVEDSTRYIRITNDRGSAYAIEDHTLDRIVACVNFCRNLPTGTLQFYGAAYPDEKPGRTPAEEWAKTIAND